jgi:hypothetical protein
MLTASAWSRRSDPAQAVAEASDRLTARLGGRPSFVVAQHTVALAADQVAAALAVRFPGVPLHGGTSCQGVMTEEGFIADGSVLGLFGVLDPDGAFGVASAELGADPEAAAMAAAERALDAAGRPGERPDLVWITGAPGREEHILGGLRLLFGPGVPVAGGSSADDAVAGGWSQFAGTQVHRDGVVVSVLFPSRGLSFSFHSGYDPTAHHGRVTASSGRTILTIDGEPAAAVYDRWTGGVLGGARQGGGNVLALTTLTPLGRVVQDVGGIPYYQLSHPNQVTPEGGLTLFSDIATGDEVVLMRGSPETLVTRAGRVAHSALGDGTSTPAGALVIYCAGCMLTVRGRMDEVSAAVRSALGGRPFLGCFTFGEQGCLPGGNNRHGNLMISVLAFHA